MLEVGAFQAKNTLGSLLDRVENGEEVLITRHGKPVARLVPTVSPNDQARAHAALLRLRALGVEHNLGKFDWEEIKKDRDVGRK